MASPITVSDHAPQLKLRAPPPGCGHGVRPGVELNLRLLDGLLAGKQTALEATREHPEVDATSMVSRSEARWQSSAPNAGSPERARR